MRRMLDPPEAGPADVDYGRYYYEHYDGGSYRRSEHWLSEFDRLARVIVERLQPSTVLDAGCAIGLLVESLRARGVDASGVDISEYAISQVAEDVREHCWQGSLAEPLPARYDLIVSIEVLEHIEEDELQVALDHICGATDRILMSSTPYHYDDPTHVNIKQPERWTAEMYTRGFVRDVTFDASFIAPWAVLYVRNRRSTVQVIEDYDRVHWYQLREIRETRQGILQLQRQLAQLEDDTVGGTALSPRQQRLELEVLRLRDELRVADRRAGAKEASAKVFHEELLVAGARLEEVDRRAREATAQLDEVRNSTSWRLIWTLMAPYRMLRGRR